jgi:hypothetical protein
MKTMTLALALAMGLGACGAKKGSAECKAFLARTLECNPELETKGTPEQITNGKDMIMRMCLAAMSGEVPTGPGAHPEMTEAFHVKVQTCRPKATCEDFNACVRGDR